MNTPIPTTLTASDARTNLYDMLEDVRKYLRRFVITHRGKPQAVLLPIEDLESWEETLDIVSNKQLMGKIRQAEKDYKKGRFVPLKQVKQSLDIRT